MGNFCDWFFKTPKTVSFINPVNYIKLTNDQKVFDKIDYFFFDGIFAGKWIGFLTRKKYERLSFDFTSIAKVFFDYCTTNEKKLFVVGGSCAELRNFLHTIKAQYPELNIVGSHHGYLEDESFSNIIHHLSDLDFDTLICGMGCPKQERFIALISETYTDKSFITCGGFIHQTQYNTRYYPKIINQLNLRMPYRFIKEPHTRRRIAYYPIFLYRTLCQFVRSN